MRPGDDAARRRRCRHARPAGGRRGADRRVHARPGGRRRPRARRSAATTRGRGPAGARRRAPSLEVRDLAVGQRPGRLASRCAPGEILGIAALEGQGQDDLFAALSGAALAGRRRDRRQGGRAARRAIRTTRSAPGSCSFPPTACRRCCRSARSRENVAAPRYNRVGALGPDQHARRASARPRRRSTTLQIDMRAQRQVRRLSGGNQQKVTIARWLASGFATLLCFDPTRGIDVGTKRQIYGLLRRLADDGGRDPVLLERAGRVPARLRPRAHALRRPGHRRAAGRGGRRGLAAVRDARPRHEEDDRSA